ncbi:solute carrier family 15 member 5 isoform X2 [Rhineura floridana]|uniref:solute carrier family 15 member 5 isoform X2 n=1 Tax=Rhineura floridana TaxID=261503 RepID=UPI002AC885EC|nr:solute carrier family 15 member 5 isoform X2 [Rhineura floridana]
MGFTPKSILNLPLVRHKSGAGLGHFGGSILEMNCQKLGRNSRRQKQATEACAQKPCFAVSDCYLQHQAMPLADMRLVQDEQLLNYDPKKEGRKHIPNQAGHGESSSRPQKELQVTICLLLVELCEKFTFFGIVCNMILFCTVKLGYPNHQAATISLCFVGACMVTPLLMGWLAECPVGRIKLVYLCALLHFVGTALLPVVAFPFEDFFIDKHYVLHTLAKREQQVLFYVGLFATCLGSGGIRAIVSPFSVYDLDAYGQKELLSFFNWFYWLENLSSAIVLVVISYIQQSVAKNLGFLIPFVSVLMALITIYMARGELIYQPPKSSCPLTVCGVVANALKVCCVKCRYFSEGIANWLDHAKENYGGQYSETQVESTKSLVRLFPLFAFQILYRICVVQIPSGYYLQTMNSNLNLNGFLLPIAAMNVISIVPLLILAPVLECLSTCLFHAKGSGWSPTVCIVAGYASATLSVMVAGFFEVYRKHFPLVEQTLSGKVLLVSSMPCIHLAPQYILLGLAEALATPTCSLITYKFVPGRIRGIALQALTFFNGAGCIMEAFLVQAAYAGSQGDWFPNNLNEGKLERFYFFLASLMMINTLGYWSISHRYTNLQQDYDEGFRGSLLQEQLLQHEKSLIFYDSILDSPSPLSPMETLL